MIPDERTCEVGNDYDSCSMFSKKRQRQVCSPILISIKRLPAQRFKALTWLISGEKKKKKKTNLSMFEKKRETKKHGQIHRHISACILILNPNSTLSNHVLSFKLVVWIVPEKTMTLIFDVWKPQRKKQWISKGINMPVIHNTITH